MLLLPQLLTIAMSLGHAKKNGRLSETLEYKWKSENTIIKELPEDEKFALLQECILMNGNIQIAELGGIEDPTNDGNFIIMFPNEFNIEIH